MKIEDKAPLDLIESRWRKFNTRPHPGEVFVGRQNNEVWTRLFVMLDSGDVSYYSDTSTHLSNPSEWFTHWLPIGEVKR